MTTQQAVQHLQNKFSAHNPIDTTGFSTASTVAHQPCKCDDCQAIEEVLHEFNKMREFISSTKQALKRIEWP